jgi:hypothetical protein
MQQMAQMNNVMNEQFNVAKAHQHHMMMMQKQ